MPHDIPDPAREHCDRVSCTPRKAEGAELRSDSGPIVILAGSGQLPVLLSDCLRRQGRDHRIVAIRGFAALEMRAQADCVVDLMDVQRTMRLLEEWRPSAVTLAGAVNRPRPSAILNTFSLYRSRRELAAIINSGDNRLLRGVVEVLEGRGYQVVGAHDLAPELLAPAGHFTRATPSTCDKAAIATGFSVIDDVAAHDIGQACVVVGERVLAIEGPEGTDQMLARVRGFRRLWSRPRVEPGGTLVKTAKRGQDLRVDLPAIGPRTIVNVQKAGLRGVAIGAGATFILEQERTIETADRLGLFLVALEPFGATERNRLSDLNDRSLVRTTLITPSFR
jgi:DUF1009 family protein